VRFALSYVVLCLVQGVLVALPRPRALPLPQRLRGRAWALVPVASIVVAVFGIRAASTSASVATYAALIASPPLAWAALAVLGVRARTAGAVVAALLGLAWLRVGLASDAAALALTALGCVTLGALLAAVTPPAWLKAGIVAMSIADTALVVAQLLQAPNDVLVSAAPAFHLPQLQRAVFGTAVMGYGDLFLAAVLGGVVAAERGRQAAVGAVAATIACVFGLLFFAVHTLPATVPIALALGVYELRRRSHAGRQAPAALRPPRRKEALWP
jgi:hypothetical protein